MKNIGSTLIFIGCLALAFFLGGKYYPVTRTDDVVLIYHDFEYALPKPIQGTFIGKKPEKPRIDTVVVDSIVYISKPYPVEDYDVEFLDDGTSEDFYARVHVMPANLDARLDSLYIKKFQTIDTLQLKPIEITKYEISDWQRAKWAVIGGAIVYLFLQLGGQ